MTVTVSDFAEITKVSRHTVYAWIYRNKLPKGIRLLPSVGTAKVLEVTKECEHFKKLQSKLTAA